MAPITLRIEELRAARGWTQAELARRAGVRPNTILDIERGRTRGVDFETLEKLARVFEVDPAYLVVRVAEGEGSAARPRARRR